MKMRHVSSASEFQEVDFIKDLNKYGMLSDPKFNKTFKVQKNKIIANEECYVTLELDDYNDEILIESKNYVLLPGIITIKSGIPPDFTQFVLPFNYQVKLIKPEDIEDSGKHKIFKFVPGDVIVQQDVVQVTADVSILIKMFEGQTKYMTNPEMLVMAFFEKMSNVDLVHFELIVSNMFRDKDNPMKPARLTTYDNAIILGQKRLPFVTSWLSAVAFENIKKAIKMGLLSGADAEENPIERIVNEQFGSDED